jgi:serine phosphatase RsbU (regulator of sigma subunit)
VLDDYVWTAEEIPLAPDWQLVLMTDGIFEGTAGPTTHDRLGMDALVGLLRAQRAASPDPAEWTEALIAQVLELNGGPMADDLALLVLRGRRTEPTG